MRWRRGFFRLWIVASIIFIAWTGLLISSQYSSSYGVWERYAFVPLRCDQARGTLGLDYGYTPIGPGAWDARPEDPRDPPRTSTCFMDIRTYQRLHPDLADGQDDATLMRTAYASYGLQERSDPPGWIEPLGAWALFSVVVCLGTLAIGWVIGWIVSGFRRPTA